MDKQALGRNGGFSLALVGFAALLGACSSGSSNGGGTTLPPGSGLCMDTCTKDCAGDNDCDMSSGEMCCDLGPAGKTCLKATQCPRQCSLDTQCDTSNGQVCVRETLATAQKYCDDASYGLTLCQSDANCGTGDVCCKNYKEPICLPPSQCPKSCTASTDCQTASGEICCATVGLIEKNLGVSGLCLNPTYASCPKACTQSTECNTTAGEICCNGICSDSCPKTCQQSSDCTNQLCCKSAMVRVPDMTTHVFSTGPSCKGTPYYTCASTSCSTVPGCVPTTAGYCSGTPYSCAYSDYYPTDCAAAGCTYTTSTSYCTGTPLACASFASLTTCDAAPGCYWYSGSTTCTGAPTPCTQLTSSTQCASQYGCTWSL